MNKLADKLIQKERNGEVMESLFEAGVSDADFAKRYFTAIPKLAVTPLTFSKVNALPFADLDATSGGAGSMVKIPKGLPATRPDKENGFTNGVVQEIQNTFKFMCDNLL